MNILILIGVFFLWSCSPDAVQENPQNLIALPVLSSKSGSFIAPTNPVSYGLSNGGSTTVETLFSADISGQRVLGTSFYQDTLYLAFFVNPSPQVFYLRLMHWDSVNGLLVKDCDSLVDGDSYSGFSIDPTSFYVRKNTYYNLEFKKINRSNCSLQQALVIPTFTDPDFYSLNSNARSFSFVEGKFYVSFYKNYSNSMIKVFDTNLQKWSSVLKTFALGSQTINLESTFSIDGKTSWHLQNCSTSYSETCLWQINLETQTAFWVQLPISEYPDFYINQGGRFLAPIDTKKTYYVAQAGTVLRIYRLNFSY